MVEESKHLTPLDQMNQILAEKEAVIEKKKKELVDYRKDLEAFETELTKKTQEVKMAQDKLKDEEIAFQQYKQNEENRIDERWKELQIYEDNLKNSMEAVIKEKVTLQTKSREQLEKELDDETSTSNQSMRMDLNALRESIGIQTVEVDEKKLQQSVDLTPEIQKSVVQKSIPKMFDNIQTEVVRVFKMQKPYVLEKTSELMCIKLGARELRVFDKVPYPEIDLVFNYKNAKSDSKLQRLITSAARTTPDWMFETEVNQLVCRLLFTHDEDPKVLIKKIKECIEVIEN